MRTPTECIQSLRENGKREWKIAFLAAFVTGILVHLPVFMMDVPNHDGLASVYFDQNMITSGRWFLTVACGISSYYTLPWLIGLLSVSWLSITCVILVDLLEIRKTELIVMVSALLVSFPALASTYAYIFTADGYMLALLLAVLAVWLARKRKWGWISGGICLAFSLGTYQGYLSVAVLLCIYMIITEFLDQKNPKEKSSDEKSPDENKSTRIRDRVWCVGKYICMGLTGVILYYVLLQILLLVQGKVLDTYQGISGMASIGGTSIFQTVVKMYTDFLSFAGKGKILFNNVFSLAAFAVLAALLLWTILKLAVKRNLYKNPWFYLCILGVAVFVPPSMNLILLISPEVGYHLLMRYQYVLLPVLALAFIQRYLPEEITKEQAQEESCDDMAGSKRSARNGWMAGLLLLIAGMVLSFNFMVSDQIGYSNLQKRYEKTYAYCLRLADRIEQTPGYYTGMPVVIMGVVGDENFPPTDITTEVTGNMIGLCGDYLCYTGQNYKDFFKHYLGITIEIVDQEQVGEIYTNSEVYHELDSFPGANCTKVVDGMLYVKTENKLEEY